MHFNKSSHFLQIREFAKHLIKVNKPQEYVRCWTEKEVLSNKTVNALVIILRTRGCRWALGNTGGCTMCGYINTAAQNVSKDDLIIQFENALKNLDNHKIVKIYTSGSFLDPAEIPDDVCRYILQKIASRVDRIVLETRPEFVTNAKLSFLKDFQIELAIGLESANDEILHYSINKGFCVADYLNAVKLVKKYGIPIRTYILIKPPFITEHSAFIDACKTAEVAAKYSEVLSFNPVNIQKNTVVEYLWHNKKYRPPWLWTVIKVLNTAVGLKEKYDIRIICSVVFSKNYHRVAHNCGKCDKKIVDAIKHFSITQDKKIIDNLTCDCKFKWQIGFEVQKFMHTAVPV